MSAWIESHQTLWRHPRKDALAEALYAGIVPDDVADVAAIGLLHKLWWWSMDYAQDGDLSCFSDRQVAKACDWRGDPAVFVGALLSSGFLNDDHTIHDWHDYAGKLISRRVKNRERMQQARSEPVHSTCTARAPHVHEDSARTCEATEPNPTIQNQEHMSAADAALVSDDDGEALFAKFWQAYPRKVGRAVALKRWRRLGKRDRLCAIAAAGHITQYVEETGTELQYVPQGDTFLGPQEKWKEWADGAPAGYARQGAAAGKRPSCPECESDLTWDEEGEHCPVCDWRAS